MNGTKPRVAVFLDFENLGNYTSDAKVQGFLADLAARSTIVTLVGCTNVQQRRRLAFRFPQVRIFTHTGGPNAADDVLIDMLQTQIPESVNTVIIASGDGIFASQANELRKYGRRVECLCWPGKLSWRLYRAVDAVHFLGEPMRISA